MAQYRAIFKRAYIKGIATAVLMTAGLAAGQAQAAEITWGTENATTKDFTITDTTTVSGSGDIFAHNLTVTGASGNLTVGTSGSGSRLVVNNELRVEDGATLTVDNGASGLIGSHNIASAGQSGGSDFTVFDGANTAFYADEAKINVKSNSSIIFVNSSLTDSTVTLESGAGIGAEPGPADRSANRGVLTLDGGTYNLANTAWLYGNNVEVTEGTVLEVSGGATTVSGSSNKTTTDIYAKSTGTLNFAGTMNIASGGAVFLGGREVKLLDGANIQNSGTLILGDEYTKQVTIEDGSDINHVNASDHAYAGSDIVMTGGTLTLDNSTATGNAGWGLIGSKEPNTASQDFVHNLTATGGVIKVKKSQIQMRNVTLGGDVEVTIGTNIGDNSGSNYADNSQINAIGEGDTGVLTVADNAELTMGEGSLLTANSFNLTGGVIELQGASGDDATNSGSSGAAMIRGYGDGILNLAGTEINIAADKAGVLRSKDINLTASTITNAGTLTIAGSVSNQSGGNTLATGTTFEMTGGTLSNTGTLKLGIGSGTETFTIAGGTFSNTGADATVNVKSGSILTLTGTTTLTPTITNTGKISVASGGTIATAGSVTLGGTGTIELTNDASGTFAGENVILNGILDVQSGSTANITGKVTFNGDGDSGTKVDLKVASGGNLDLKAGGTLIINDVEQTIGLSYTKADSGVGTFTVDSGFAGFTSGSAGTLYLDVAAVKDLGGTTIANDDIEDFANSIKSEVASGSTIAIKLDGVTFDLGSAITSGNSANFADVDNVLSTGVSDGQLDNTSINITKDDAAAQVQGSIGQVAIAGDAGIDSVTVGTKTPLILNGHEVDGVSQGTALVTVGTGDTATVGGAKVQAGSVLTLGTTTGTIADITADQADAGTVAVAAGSTITVVDDKTTAASVANGVADSVVRGNIGTKSQAINTVSVEGALEAKDVYATNLNLTGANSNLVAEDVAAGTATVAGSLTAQKVTSSDSFTTAQGSTLSITSLDGAQVTLAGNTAAQTIEASNSLTFTGGSHDITKEVVAQGALVVDQAASVTAASVEAQQGLSVVGDATLSVENLDIQGGDLKVGSDANNGTGGTLSALFLDLNDNDLVIDPAFGQAASVVAVAKVGTNASAQNAGTLNGGAYALQNSVLALGTSNVDQVKATLAPLMDEKGSLSADNIGAVVYIADELIVAANQKIVADSSATDSTLDKAQYANNAITLGNNSALAISVDAAQTGPAITFENDATISAAGDAKVLLTGDFSSTDTLNLFQDGGNDGIELATDTSTLRIETLNGLLYTEWSTADGAISTISIEEMDINRDQVARAYTDTSSSVRNSLIAYATGDSDWANHGKTNWDINASRIHGARVDGVIYNGTDYTNADGSALAAGTDTSNWTYVLNPAYDANNPTAAPQYLAYEKADNGFLTAIREQPTTLGAAADSAAHMAEFGGVAQVALKAGSTTTDAIAGRMGMGAQNSAITFANNGQGAGIWITPIYVSSDSDGFEAQGVDYGTDINLYGVALGGDYTLANGVRIGAMFNVGSGDADGQGAGSAVTSDFDYYGFGLYAGYSVGQFSVVGDVSYTAVDNDVEANTNIDKLETSLDSSNLSVGVTGSYAFETAAGVTVTPHVGLRYSNIDIDDYSVKGKTYGTVGDYSADSLSVFSIPVGVTIASEFQAGTWSVKPSFDLTLTGNFGDDEAEGTFHWAGVENIDSNLNSEIFDNFTYGASLGIAAQSSSGISLGVAVGYTGSSNVDDFGVNANARFTF